MSHEQDKFKNSKRRLNDETAISKQVKIAKAYNFNVVETPHRYVKRHALNCGNPKCMLCSNPRKTFKELSIQEKKLFQNIDKITNKGSNGNKVDDE